MPCPKIQNTISNPLPLLIFHCYIHTLYNCIFSRHHHIVTVSSLDCVCYNFFFLLCYLLLFITFLGESPSSSASDIDNLNNNGLSKGPSSKDANSPQVTGNNLLLAARNQPHLTRLLAYVSSSYIDIYRQFKKFWFREWFIFYSVSDEFTICYLCNNKLNCSLWWY